MNMESYYSKSKNAAPYMWRGEKAIKLEKRIKEEKRVNIRTEGGYIRTDSE